MRGIGIDERSHVGETMARAAIQSHFPLRELVFSEHESEPFTRFQSRSMASSAPPRTVPGISASTSAADTTEEALKIVCAYLETVHPPPRVPTVNGLAACKKLLEPEQRRSLTAGLS